MDVTLNPPERKRPSTWSFSAKQWAVLLPEPCSRCGGLAIFRSEEKAYCELCALQDTKGLSDAEIAEFWSGVVQDGLRSAGVRID